MKVGRLLKYESREVCTTRLHKESFPSYLAISISAQIFGANSWRWFYNSRRARYARVLNGKTGLASCLQLVSSFFNSNIHVEIPFIQSRISIQIGFESALIGRSNCFSCRWSRVREQHFSNFLLRNEIPRRLVRLARPITLLAFYRKANRL